MEEKETAVAGNAIAAGHIIATTNIKHFLDHHLYGRASSGHKVFRKCVSG
jgi:hypothetical protein